MDLPEIPDDSTLEVKERIVIEIRYYDEMENVILATDNAKRIEINIKKSVYLKALVESYSEEESFGEGERIEITTDSDDYKVPVYTTIIEKEAYSSLSEILLLRLNTKVKNITLSVDSPTDIEIKEEVINLLYYS
jgi:hypothetical protein